MKRLLSALFIIIVCATSGMARVKISNQGLEFIKSIEKCKLTAYADANGYSIGYGHHTKEIYEGMTITQRQADEYLRQDIAYFEKAAERLLKALPYEYEFSQGFIDGFISFIYNVGEGGAKNSLFYQTLMKCRVKNGVMDITDYHFALSKIKTSKISCEHHKKRRVEEYKMMIS